MSFFSDLTEGHFDKLGTDLTHAPSSLINHPDELAETLGGAALIAAPFVIPAVGSALGIGGAAAGEAGAAAAGGGLATDLGIGDIGAAAAADSAAEAGALGIGAAETGTAIGDALALTPETADALGVGGAIAAAPESVFTGLGTSIPDAFSVGEAPVAGDISGTAPQFAQTDAELTGGITGAGGAAPAASDSGSFLGNAVSKAGDWLANPANDLKLALGVAPLALTLARGESSLPGQVGPAQANAAALASQGANLNASQQATLNQQRQDALNAMRQALFNQGVTNPTADTRYAQYVQLVDQQVTAAATQMIQNNIQNSLAGDQQLIQIAQLQMNADQAFTNNLVNATKALGTVAGMNSGITLKVA